MRMVVVVHAQQCAGCACVLGTHQELLAIPEIQEEAGLSLSATVCTTLKAQKEENAIYAIG